MGDYQDGDRIYATHWLSMKRAIAGDVIVTGIAVTETSPASMSVDVSAGHFYQNGTRQVIAGTNIAVSPSDTTNARLDLISGGPAGLVYTAGTPALLVAPPDLPAGHIAIAMIYVPANSTTVVQANIREFAFPSPFREHATQHEDGGDDIVTPAIHGSRHGYGIADELNVEDLATTEFTTDKFLQPGGAGNLVWGDVQKEIEVALVKRTVGYSYEVVPLFPWEISDTPVMHLPTSRWGTAWLYCSAWSNDTNFFATVGDTPHFKWWKREGLVLTDLGGLPVVPNAIVRYLAWSPQDDHVAICGAFTTPSSRLAFYKRIGDTLTKLSDPATMPGTEATSVQYSPSGEHVIVTFVNSPSYYIYKRSGDTYTLIATPSITATGNRVAWSPDGNYLAIGLSASPYVMIIRRSGDTFTHLTGNIDILPTGGVHGLSFSPNGLYLWVGSVDTTQYSAVYKISGENYTRVATPTIANPGWDGDWSANSQYLAIGSTTDTYPLRIFKRTNDTFALQSYPTFYPTGQNMVTVRFWKDQQFLNASFRGDGVIDHPAYHYQTQHDIESEGILKTISPVRRIV